MFNTYKSSFFFLLSSDFTVPRIVTNHPGLKPIKFFSNSTRPNVNFIVANFISGIMRFLNWVDAPDKNKIFVNIRRHLIIQLKALDARKLSQAPNFNQTKTFFRFSYKKQTVYFGIYLPCQSLTSCITPCNYITKSQQLCFSHSLIDQSRLSKLQTTRLSIKNVHHLKTN